MIENEMNFQYLEYLDVEFLNSNFELKKRHYSVLKKAVHKNPVVMERRILM